MFLKICMPEKVVCSLSTRHIIAACGGLDDEIVQLWQCLHGQNSARAFGWGPYVSHHHHDHRRQQFIIDHVFDLILDHYRARTICTCATQICCRSCWPKKSQCVIRSNPLQTTVVRVNSSVKQFKRVRKTMRSSSVHHEARPPLQSFCTTLSVVVTSVVITTNQYDKRRVHSHQYHTQHWPYFWFGGLTGRCVCKVIEQRLRLGIWFRVRY